MFKPALLVLLIGLGLSQGQDDLALAESRQQHGFFKGFGYGEFGFKDGAHSADGESEEGDEGKQVQPIRVKYPVKKEEVKPQEKKKEQVQEEEKDEQAFFEAFRDYYFKSQEEEKKPEQVADKKQEDGQKGLLKVKVQAYTPIVEEQKEEAPKQAHKAISYAYSTIEHNRYYPKYEKPEQKKAEERSEDGEGEYYYYVKRY